MKPSKALLLCAFLLFTLFPGASLSAAENPAPETALTYMESIVAAREVKVASWRQDIKIEVTLAILVGLIGLAIGSLQTTEKPWVKRTTVGLGLFISALTLCTHTIFTADYPVLRRAVESSDPVLEELHQDIVLYRQVSETRGNTTEIFNSFIDTQRRFNEIARDVVGEAVGAEAPSQTAANASLFQGSFSSVVHAQSSQGLPAWTGTNGSNDSSASYFVGMSDNASLDAAKSASYDNAVYNGVKAVLAAKKGVASPAALTQTNSLVRNAATVTNTWLTYNSGSRSYRCYTRIRLPQGLSRVPLRF